MVKAAGGGGRAGRTRAVPGPAQPATPAPPKGMREQWAGWFNSSADLKSRLDGLRQASERAGRPIARDQYAALEYMERAAVSNGMPAGGYGSLGQTIMVQQWHRIAQRGDRAYPLSDKQVGVVLRELEPYRRR